MLEKWFIQAIVDGYMQEWDRKRRGKRITLWQEAVEALGVARYLGSPDDLKLLLMKAVNRRNKADFPLCDFSLSWSLFLRLPLCQSWAAGSTQRS